MTRLFVLAMRIAAMAGLAGGGAAWAQAPAPAAADNVNVWTIQIENDTVSTDSVSDRYYSNGLRLGWTSTPGLVPSSLQGLGNKLWGAGEARISVDLTHQVYTPFDTKSGNPPANDRPFAGVLMANFALVQDSANTRSTLALGLGLVGPGAGGQTVQNGFHDLIDQRKVRGWNTQLRNEPLLQITSERTWRLPLGRLAAIETDALPSLTASVGNLLAYIQTGVTLRLGQGLDADFGTARPRPGLTGGDYFRRVRPLAWYLFLGVDGRLVGRDLTLDGNSFANSRSVKKYPGVGEVQAGLAVMAYGMRLTYTHRLTSPEFRGQRRGLHQTGSLALSVRF